MTKTQTPPRRDYHAPLRVVRERDKGAWHLAAGQIDSGAWCVEYLAVRATDPRANRNYQREWFDSEDEAVTRLETW